MSHGATSTQQKMAFNNNPHSFSSIGGSAPSDARNANAPLNTPFTGRSNAWGSSSIWSGGLTSGLTPSTNNLVSRDNMQQTITSMSPEAIQGKTGSGSLVDSSVSEEYANRTWNGKRTNPVSRSASNARYADSSLQQHRSGSNAGLSTNQSSMSFASRPPTMNSDSRAAAQTMSAFGSSFANGYAGRTNEQPPFNVYTKFDRPTDPAQRKPDSAIGSWADSATTPSPTDERRPYFPSHSSRGGSIATSRDGSAPPSRHADEALVFARPEYSRLSQHATPNSSRAPSISSSRNGAYNSHLNADADHMFTQLAQLSMSGDNRPSTSHKLPCALNGHLSQAKSAMSRPSPPGSHPVFGQSDHADEIDHGSMSYPGFDGYPGSYCANPAASFAERYFQSGNAYEFRPGQPYTGGGVLSRAGEPPGSSRSSQDSQHVSGGSSHTGRRSPAMPDQPYMDPRLQQLMATQLRSAYLPMYSPYALPNALQFNAAAPPYSGLMPLNLPGMDAPSGPRDASVGDGVQSALMYEFKSNTKTKRYELRDIYDHIAEFSGDQHGSRFIQTKLETANSDEKERVFREIEPNAIPLMTDVFGNYVIQKFFEHGDQTHKKILANKMRGQVLQLSLQMYGCRVVQKALDHVLVDQQALLISELENHVLKCVKDQNGNHVIQKAIERCPSPTIGFIISAFQGQVQHLSIHPYGCRVIQRCLEKCDLPSKSMIMSELMEGIQPMISDQFGNYVVQHIVSHDDGESKRRVLNIVGRGLEGYSKHKFASNVVEKCLERSDDLWRRDVVYSLAQANARRTEGEGVLVGLIKDNFGNYVIQKLLDTLSPEDYILFLDMLQPAMNQAKRTGCGKQVLSIDKKMHRFDAYRGGGLPVTAPFNHPGFHMPLPTPHFASNLASAATTPPPLTADTQSLQSSALPSVNGDAVEGAALSRKGSGQSSETGIPR